MNRFALILMFALLLLMSALANKINGPTPTLRPKPTVTASAPVQRASPQPPQKVRHLPRTDN